MVPLQAAARKLGAWCWAERRCFEILGGWVRDTEEPAIKAMLAVHSRHHAWRAERWSEILPRAYVAPLEQLVSDPADAAVFDALEAVEGSGQRLAAHYHLVYRELVSAYEASPDLMSPTTDAPALRAIRIIVGDALHDLAEAEVVSTRSLGGISGPDHLTHLHDAVAKVQVRADKSGAITSSLLCWGS
ncbi:MAG: hypothetical protein IT196_00020 [Acidimicrobiales bacterium]|nr:hypothetical protein [Acidimicrobiales bacterium]